MNEFYESLMTPVIYRWAKSQDGVEACCHSCTLCIESHDMLGEIRFHEDNIVELAIENVHTQESVFYLHFQMHDMKSSLEQFQIFFHYLQGTCIQDEDIIISDTQVKKILLSCSGGLTTSYFAYAMQDIIDQRHLDIHVDAVAYSDIDDVANQYDVILLAPQISYMLADYKNKYGNKVMNISSINFATSRFEGIIQQALNQKMN